jgi:hypothetical protein
MKKYFRNTPGGKAGSIDGMNLFFGALLGANLGTMQSLPLYQYVQIILVLAGAVMVLRMLSTSQQRARIFGVLAIYVVLISIMVFVPGLRPKGLPAGDFNKLIATLAVWVVCVVAVELSPVQEDGYL